MTFEDKHCTDFRQIESGHWVADNFDGKTFTSVEKFEKGSTGGERFKHLQVREATEDEIREFIDIVIFNKGKVAIFI
jgi:hypothetical protein